MDPVLDPSIIEELQELSGADEPDFLREQVRLFRSRGRQLAYRLRVARSAMDLVALRNAAHALAGSATIIGAARLSTLCLVIESCCDRRDVRGALDAVEPVVNAFEEADHAVLRL